MSAQAHTILLVDDNPDLLEMVSDGLSSYGYFVMTALDGIDGLEKASTMHPDCVVIDVKMPGLNGNQLVQLLRGDPATAHIPLVMLTALAQERDQFAGMATGADQYLIKPQPPSAIHVAIQRALALDAAARREQMRTLVETAESETGLT